MSRPVDANTHFPDLLVDSKEVRLSVFVSVPGGLSGAHYSGSMGSERAPRFGNRKAPIAMQEEMS